MRTWPALNEQYKWESSSARDAECVTCHLLALVSELGLEELGEGLLRSRGFERFERGTAELQRVEYVGLGPAGLTSFLVNLHNIMVLPSTTSRLPRLTHQHRRPLAGTAWCRDACQPGCTGPVRARHAPARGQSSRLAASRSRRVT
jgi:hypothetical protein